jgi:hypothetical protein
MVSSYGDAQREFCDTRSPKPVPLARGALLIAKEEYPDLDLDAYHDKIAALAREASRSFAGADTIERISCCRTSCSSRRVSGRRRNFGDPRNSFLNEVINGAWEFRHAFDHLPGSRAAARNPVRRVVSSSFWSGGGRTRRTW